MVANLWKKIKWVCANRHEQPIPFVLMQGTSAFYACPRYMRKDAQHPLGHDVDERACPNRISLYEEPQIVEVLNKIIEEDLMSGAIVDYTNLVFHYKHIEAKVLKYSDSEITISLLNKKAVK